MAKRRRTVTETAATEISAQAPQVRYEDWQAELINLMGGPAKPDDPGMTALEMAAALGMGMHATQVRVSKLLDAGQLIKGRAHRRREDGRLFPVSVYMPAKKAGNRP